MIPYDPPKFNEPSFNCPHCHTNAQQYWINLNYQTNSGHNTRNDYRVSSCHKCSDVAIWHNENMVYPKIKGGPPPNPDMPPEVKEEYDQAATILQDSPKGAAALLRLGIEKLAKGLGEDDKNLDENIGFLVREKGLSTRVQRALDVVRVIGNKAVHPGTIDLSDNPETAEKLFKMVNVIVRQTISDEKDVDDLYDESLTDGEKQHTEERDG